MNEKQKDNVAKFLYDLVKIIFAITVIGPIAKPEEFNTLKFILCVMVCVILFVFAYYLDKKQLKTN